MPGDDCGKTDDEENGKGTEQKCQSPGSAGGKGSVGHVVVNHAAQAPQRSDADQMPHMLVNVAAQEIASIQTRNLYVAPRSSSIEAASRASRETTP